MNGEQISYFLSFSILVGVFFAGCKTRNDWYVPRNIPPRMRKPVQNSEKLRTAIFGGGSFWCIEEIFEEVAGVDHVLCGFSGGKIENPTFKQVQYGNTAHAECVQIFYDPKVVTYTTLLDIFFMGAHDPTQINKQGPDEGTQFRSIIFYKTEAEKRSIASKIKMINESNTFSSPVATQVKKIDSFYSAKSEQQDYFTKNPDNIYINGVTTPIVKSFRIKFKKYLKPKYKS